MGKQLGIPDCSENPNHMIFYNDRWDSYFCSECLIWVEVTCGDADCRVCGGRPEKPTLEHKSSVD